MRTNTSFLKTAALIETQNSCVEVSYLKSNTFIHEADNATNLTLKLASNILHLTEKSTIASNTKFDFKRLSEIGIDVNSILESTLVNEYELCAEGRLFNLYCSLGKENYTNQFKDNAWQNFMRKIFLSKKTHYFNSVNDLVNLIFTGSNSIQVSSRMGYADFVIMSPLLATMLMESPSYVTFPDRDISRVNIFQTGTLRNIKIFIHPTAEDDFLVFGRESKLYGGSVGVVYAKMPSEVQKIEDVATHSFYTTYKTYDVIDKVDTEQSYRSYLTMPISLGKPPLWKKLFKL